MVAKDRAEAIGKSSGPAPQSVALLQKAITLVPDHWDAYNTLSGVLQDLGREEHAWKVGAAIRTTLVLLRRAPQFNLGEAAN